MDNGACSYRRYLEGDEEAFTQIVDELFDHLVFFINRYVQDLYTAEDIAIDTFSDLVVHKQRYDFRVSLKTYLFMVGRSRALSYLRKQRRHPYLSLSDMEDAVPDERFETAFLLEERKAVLNQALAQLPADMQAAIHLVYFEDLTYDEAARVMKKTKKQVDNLLYRAKKALRTTLEKEEVDL